ncbi:hypothetical protein D3C81_1593380 [compost metagenome]
MPQLLLQLALRLIREQIDAHRYLRYVVFLLYASNKSTAAECDGARQPEMSEDHIAFMGDHGLAFRVKHGQLHVS